MSLIWFEGQLRADEIALSAHDRGLTLGDGIFETLLVRERKAIWRDQHLQRMERAAATLGLPFPKDDVGEAVSQLSEQGASHHALRLTLTRGVVARGLAGEATRPTFIASLDSFGERLMFKPARLITSTIHRNETSPLSRIKSLSYGDNILAAREAAKAGADDALLLNTKGYVACTTIGNVFAMIDGKLITPPTRDGALPGIARQMLMKNAAERSVTLGDLRKADAIFLTNSLRLLRPVTELDGVKRTTFDFSPYEKALLASL